MNEIIFMVHEPPEGGYPAEALGHSIFTGGDTLEELNEMVREAVLCHFDEGARPENSHCRMKLPCDLSGDGLARALAQLATAKPDRLEAI